MNCCIGILGGSMATGDVGRMAEQVGSEIARHGATLICGGRTGVMEAACKGAKKQGGLTIGILPGEDRDGANPFVDIPIVTGMGIGRNIIVVRSSQAVIAIDGKYGTLSEIAHALQIGTPVIGLQTWDVSEDIYLASSPKEAIELAFKLIK